MSCAAAKAACRDEMVEPGETREVTRDSLTLGALATVWARPVRARQAQAKKMRCRRLTGGISTHYDDF